MKKVLLTIALIIPFILQGQDSIKIYNPYADATTDLAAAIQKAKSLNKHVLVQIGGNWCPWCIRLHQFVEENRQIDSIVKADFVLLRINYSKENKNPEVLSELEYPQRFGFPVLVVIDQNGKRLHTQDTGLLEKDKSYDAEKISRFLLSWNRSAVNPDTYSKKQ